MARFHPEQVPTWMEESGPERRVRQRLEVLDDRWHVVHHFAWRRPAPGRYQLGEGDFVLIHPERGVLVLEVKGGQVACHDGVWTTTRLGGATHEIEDPLLQADRTARWIIASLRREPEFADVRVRVAVVLPAVRVDGDLSPNVPRSVIVDADDLSDVASAVDRLCALHGLHASLSDEDADRLAQVLSPTVTTSIHLRVSVEDVNERLVELTGAQSAILDLLDFQYRATITGGSGTGKTALAVEKARRLARSGDRVLLTCFNRMLADHLRDQVAGVPSIHVDNFHGLAWNLVHRAGLGRPAAPAQDWWDVTAPALLPRAARMAGFEVDSIVIDEAQDFTESWLEALEALLDDPASAHVYRFADSEQDLYERTTAGTEALERTFPLTRNLRATRQIASRLDALWGVRPAGIGPNGPEPQLLTAEDPDTRLHLLRNEVHRLRTKGGLRREQLVILCASVETVDRLLALDRLLDHPFWRADQAVADTRVSPPPVGALQVETVHRFKGLESDAVILLLDEVETLRDRRVAYVGMGRARSVLSVIGPPQLRAALNWS